MKEKNEKTEKAKEAENIEKSEKSEKPEKSSEAPSVPARSPQAAAAPLPSPSEKPSEAPSVPARSPQAAAAPLQSPSEKPSEAPSVPARSSQAVAAPLQSPSEKPSEAPSLSSLATKVCQGLSGMEDSDIRAITLLATSLLEDIEKGKLRKDTIKALLQSLHYDRDIAAANHEGEIKGRNAKIEELMAEHERTANIHMPTGARTNLRTSPPPHVIGGLAAADRRTIWERGNEKRTIY